MGGAPLDSHDNTPNDPTIPEGHALLSRFIGIPLWSPRCPDTRPDHFRAVVVLEGWFVAVVEGLTARS